MEGKVPLLQGPEEAGEAHLGSPAFIEGGGRVHPAAECRN